MAIAKASYGIQKLPGGKGYSVRPWILNPHTNKKEQIFKQSKKWTKDDAKNYVERIIKNADTHFLPNNGNKSNLEVSKKQERLSMESTVHDLYCDYYSFAKLKLKPGTLEGYMFSYNMHIHPQLGHYKLKDIDENVITDWQMYLLGYEKKKGNLNSNTSNKHLLRNSSIKNIIVVLRNMVDHGIKKRKLVLNSIKIDAEVDRAEQEHIPGHWTKEERNKFFEIVAQKGDIRDMALYAFLLVTGVRRNEALALHPDRINFEEKKIIINSSLTRKNGDGPTKTNRTRIIKLDDLTIKLLKKCVEELEGKNDYDPKLTYVFGGALPYATSTFRRRFNSYKKEMKKKYPSITTDVTLHGLRHSVATTIGDEHGIEQVSIYLNHSSIRTSQKYVRIKHNEKVLETVALGIDINFD